MSNTLAPASNLEFDPLFEGSFAEERKTEHPPSNSFSRLAFSNPNHDERGRFTEGGQGIEKTQADVSPYQVISSSPRGDLKIPIKDTFDSINSVHTLPDGSSTFPIKISHNIKDQAQYIYREYTDPKTGKFLYETPEQIAINPDLSQHIELSLAHEFGHYVDGEVFGRGHNQPQSVSNEYDNVFKTISESQAFSTLKSLSNSADKEQKARSLVYMSKAESFARAYSQWTAEKSNNSQMRVQAFEVTVDQRPGADSYKASQWDDKDFSPISKAMDSLFRAKGLLK